MKNTTISDAQWLVMKVLWAKSPATANDVIDALSTKTTWNPKTIRTHINRLVQKKAVAFEKKGRKYHYYPIITENQCLLDHTRSFLDRLRDSSGALKPVLAAFLQEKSLTGSEIAELKKILDKKGGD